MITITLNRTQLLEAVSPYLGNFLSAITDKGPGAWLIDDYDSDEEGELISISFATTLPQTEGE